MEMTKKYAKRMKRNKVYIINPLSIKKYQFAATKKSDIGRISSHSKHRQWLLLA
jgi:hypothetical protein